MSDIVFHKIFVELRWCDNGPISQMGKLRHREVKLIKQWNWVSHPCLSNSKGHLQVKEVVLGENLGLKTPRWWKTND